MEEAIPSDDIFSLSPYRWIKKPSRPREGSPALSCTFPSADRRPSPWSPRCALPQVERTLSPFLPIPTLGRMEPAPWYPVPNAACRFMLVSVSFFAKAFRVLRNLEVSLYIAYIQIVVLAVPIAPTFSLSDPSMRVYSSPSWQSLILKTHTNTLFTGCFLADSSISQQRFFCYLSFFGNKAEITKLISLFSLAQILLCWVRLYCSCLRHRLWTCFRDRFY